MEYCSAIVFSCIQYSRCFCSQEYWFISLEVMKNIRDVIMLLILLFTIQQTSAFAHADTLHLEFSNRVNNEIMELGKIYTNAFDEPFTIRAFKYYISNIQLVNSNEQVVYNSNEVFLINEAEEASKRIHLATPAVTFSKIRFLLGVDSICNTSGVQTGNLDPAKGMFWVWNTGFIMAKMEGNSPAAKTPGHLFTYDIGGYKQGENAARMIELTIPQQTIAPAKFLILANAAAWFKSTTEIHIASDPLCHAAGALAMKLADNYSTMFSIAAE